MTQITSSDAPSPTVIVAPDAFKGSATAEEAARWIGEGVRSIIQDAHITIVPMADGGEGTSSLFDGERITLPTTDAAGRLTEASYTFNREEATAYIDVAAATGLPAVQDALEDHPVATTGDTYGTGVLIADAETRGARRIVLGLGGSATVDGGTGILVALGAHPLDSAGHPLNQGGAALVDLADFDTARVNIPAASMEWVLLADALVPATGKRGAARIFGPQKGADANDVELLDRALGHLCDVTGVDPQAAGYGAAGGVAIGLTWLSALMHGNTEHITVVSGARVVAEAAGMAELAQKASLVITGEGRYDEQTAEGKVASAVLDIVQQAGTTAAVVAGSFSVEVPDGVLRVELNDDPSLEEQLRRAGADVAIAYLNTATVQG
ncbi:Glycerate 2-kinase [Corynebacterium capitovis DSM 44611]|uniref:glycerate kinase family protein n=1 Tax=Corynebacterium capitovis TaxID=131081 RepID=UPI000371247D|nr:glycerate kinase [Corynebacterium capitovis]WKD57423.1 Glycerate 2-kinase [Corynebacterium capitovis DSM 44611]